MVPTETEQFKFSCIKCNYFTTRESQYNRHLLTSKHNKTTDSNEKIPINKKTYKCECGRSYKHKTTLYAHRNNCKASTEECENILNVEQTPISVETSNNSAMMMALMQQNQTMLIENKELKTLIIDLASKVGNNNNNTITNNNSFNLNVFLNETCKDAININDFIKNIEIQLKEIENIGNNGYVSGITDIIVSRLKQLDVTKRPVHCTDLKRETLYIKDEDTWNKDTNDNTKMRNVVTTVAKKSYKIIPKWRQENPECQDPENEKYTFCINMMRNTLGELDESHQTKIDDKIIKNVAKLVVLDKNPTM
jgi:hypothetical protein